MKRMGYTPSLQRHLLSLLLTVVVAGWSLVAWWVYSAARHEVEELFNANLAQTARALLNLAHHQYSEGMPFDQFVLETPADSAVEAESSAAAEEEDSAAPVEAELPPVHRYAARVSYCIYLPRKSAVLCSDDAPDSLTVPPYQLAALPAPGFRDELIDGEKWRFFAIKDAELEIYVQAGESYQVRSELAGQILLSSMMPLLLGLPALALAIWFSVGHSLRPLQRAAREIEARTPDNLQPVDMTAVPCEIQPLLHTLNRLLASVAKTFENERRFTADAAHELRTPLASIQTQAEVALRSQDPAQQHQALEKITAGTARAAHLVRQLLTLARIESAQALPPESVNLVEIAEEVIVELAATADAKQLDLGLDSALQELPLQASRDALLLLLRNLVENSIAYTPPQGRVSVTIQQRDGAVWLGVIDTGSGIPPEQRERVFERFYRGSPSEFPGSGLGLSIVRRIAELHDAQILLETGDHGMGLRFWVRFGTTKPN